MNSTEKLIFKALIDSDNSKKRFMLVIDEDQNYLILKENIRIKDSQLGEIERNRLIKHNRRIGIDKILKQNEGQSLKLKTEV